MYMYTNILFSCKYIKFNLVSQNLIEFNLCNLKVH